MKFTYADYDENHEFDKKEAQLLISELESFVTILKKMAKAYVHNEGFHRMYFLIDYISKLTEKLFFELGAGEIDIFE